MDTQPISLKEFNAKKQELTPEQRIFVTKAIATWFRILEENKRFPPTMADVSHSVLLQRLLSGKDPLPKVPPRACSYLPGSPQ